jgi:hypothetical protein
VHWVGTRAVAFNPPPCTGHHSCPFNGGFLRQSYGATLQRPLEVPSGKQVGLQLNFRLADCDAVPLASLTPTRLLSVAYRSGGGVRYQTLPLRGAALHFSKPVASACPAHRPSALTVDGGWAGSTLRTVDPVRPGDTCSRHGAAFTFTGRFFESYGGGPWIQIRFVLPVFNGRAIYHRARVTLVAGIGIHGWEPFRAGTATVAVRRSARHAAVGTLDAMVVTKRVPPSHVHGVWRCNIA